MCRNEQVQAEMNYPDLLSRRVNKNLKASPHLLGVAVSHGWALRSGNSH